MLNKVYLGLHEIGPEGKHYLGELYSIPQKCDTDKAHETLQEVEKALDCPHIAADAALALNRVYSGLHEMEPEGGRYLIRWARILMRPSLLHIEQTCEALEQALMGDTSEAVLPPEARMRGEPFMTCPRQPRVWCSRR